jgi:hypothetical protein
MRNDTVIFRNLEPPRVVDIDGFYSLHIDACDDPMLPAACCAITGVTHAAAS